MVMAPCGQMSMPGRSAFAEKTPRATALVAARPDGYNSGFPLQIEELFVRKDKKKVVGEPMSDEQVAVFLNFRPRDPGESVDLYMLTRAYRGLRAHDFARFLEMFLAAGHDINAIDADGRTMLKILREHAQAEEYVEALVAAGARSID